MIKKSFLRSILAVVGSCALLLSGCGMRLPNLRGTLVDGNLYKDSTINFKTKKIGILDFVSRGVAGLGTVDLIASSTSGQWAADMITTELLFDGFQMVERQHISRLIDERDSTMISWLAQSEKPEAVQRIGKMLGADFMMVGAITFYGYDPYRGAGAVGMTTRLIDVNTGRICWVFSASRRSNSLQAAMYGICLAIKESLIQENVYVWQRG